MVKLKVHRNFIVISRFTFSQSDKRGLRHRLPVLGKLNFATSSPWNRWVERQRNPTCVAELLGYSTSDGGDGDLCWCREWYQQ
jgi:hypothetical protein